jgi:hypothetical protein
LVFLPIGCFLADGNIDLGQFGQNTKIDTTGYSHSQIVVYEDTVNKHALDSICLSEELPDFDMWTVCDFYDYETGTTITKCLYLKPNNDGTVSYYVVTGNNDPYIIEKRIGR